MISGRRTLRPPAFAHQPISRVSAVNAVHSAMPIAVGSSAASSVHFALPVSRRIVQSVVDKNQNTVSICLRLWGVE